MAVIQLDLFEPPPTEIDFIKADIEETKKSLGNVRRGIFSRHNDLSKLYIELESRLTSIDKKLDMILVGKKT